MRREALCALYGCLQGQIRPRTACDTHIDGITPSADGLCLHHHTTPHHTTPPHTHHTTPHHTTPHHTTPHHTTPHHTTPHHTTPHHTSPTLSSKPSSVQFASCMHLQYSFGLCTISCLQCFLCSHASTYLQSALPVQYILSVDALCNTSVLYCLVLHIVLCPRQLSFVLQMAAAWSSGAVA